MFNKKIQFFPADRKNGWFFKDVSEKISELFEDVGNLTRSVKALRCQFNTYQSMDAFARINQHKMQREIERVKADCEFIKASVRRRDQNDAISPPEEKTEYPDRVTAYINRRDTICDKPVIDFSQWSDAELSELMYRTSKEIAKRVPK